MTLPEEWRSVVDDQGNEHGSYQVSNLGRVMSTKGLRPRIIRGWVENNGYRRINLDGRQLLLGRLVAMAFLPNPEGLPEVDHIDRNPLNNRVENLRWASRSMNSLNRRTWGKCCYRGVSFNKRQHQYVAQIWHQGVKVYLGSYDTPEEAASVYDCHARELRGSDALTNFDTNRMSASLLTIYVVGDPTGSS
jgi:hypothetical protein